MIVWTTSLWRHAHWKYLFEVLRQFIYTKPLYISVHCSLPYLHTHRWNTAAFLQFKSHSYHWSMNIGGEPTRKRINKPIDKLTKLNHHLLVTLASIVTIFQVIYSQVQKVETIVYIRWFTTFHILLLSVILPKYWSSCLVFRLIYHFCIWAVLLVSKHRSQNPVFRGRKHKRTRMESIMASFTKYRRKQPTSWPHSTQPELTILDYRQLHKQQMLRNHTKTRQTLKLFQLSWLLNEWMMKNIQWIVSF